MSRAYYSSQVSNFLQEDENSILGKLTKGHQFALEELQKRAWLSQIRVLKRELRAHGNAHLYFEYSIPRMGKRADVILLSHGVVFVIEFKAGDSDYSAHALDQVLDYSLDLKNFHEQSHDKIIIPILTATQAPAIENAYSVSSDGVATPVKTNEDNLAETIEWVISQLPEIPNDVRNELDAESWDNSIYKPTPTIVEAAQALYKGHNVAEISRSDASAKNLSRTSETISAVIDSSEKRMQKSICFVTGVPGSGKTLAGLNIANERHRIEEEEHSVFLSGNGPLVAVLQEALARDQSQNDPSGTITKRESLSRTRAFIQNIHHFRDDAIASGKAPVEKVVIFDEAQRAWDREQTASFMQRKKGLAGFERSEPEFLIDVMNRHEDWATIVCIVGGGQEINTGEAGLVEWFKAIRDHHSDWDVYASHRLSDHEYLGEHQLSEFIDKNRLHVRDDLHLAVSVRSFRSEKVSALVKALLDSDQQTAEALYGEVNGSYPIVVTRNIETAKQWLKEQARGTERYGLVASSGGHRLRPFGINVKAKIDPKNWFLNGKEDVRSSYYLEDVATEFDIQGLELDWTCVAWDADLRFNGTKWEYRNFRGTTWQNINDERRKLYLKNAYRVLLTRARQGMILFVPEGDIDDQTRHPEFYDKTFRYLIDIGMERI